MTKISIINNSLRLLPSIVLTASQCWGRHASSDRIDKDGCNNTGYNGSIHSKDNHDSRIQPYAEILKAIERETRNAIAVGLVGATAAKHIMIAMIEQKNEWIILIPVQQ